VGNGSESLWHGRSCTDRHLAADEATSALDAITERWQHQRLAALHCTRIVIAHACIPSAMLT
jgi:hypothetical protein